MTQRLLGRVRRADGSQEVTYAGHPVVEFGGRWLVVSRVGAFVR